jgi:ABC-type multidrug transport system fused ATPase/permease subunit
MTTQGRFSTDRSVAFSVQVIAHRLSTIMNSHHVLVLDNGNILEYGTPQELQQNENGRFSQMWKMQNEFVG